MDNYKKRMGIAIDVGTTMIALEVVDLETGRVLASDGARNEQVRFGADVTSRITYCTQHGHGELTTVIREQINLLVDKMINGENAAKCERYVIAANTVMQHLVAGLSPVSMGTAPFTPVSYFGEYLPAWDSLPAQENTDIYYTPAIAAYVGGDITAGLLAAGIDEFRGSALFIDIGTNGEIALWHKGTFYCCATAAGPAFEGLSSVNMYGSDLIDLLAEMLDSGAIDNTGRLLSKESAISFPDIRQLQLAKAAIAGGVQVLLHYAGIKVTDITLLALAGGFGSCINPESAVRIGLFPEPLLPVAKAFGNTSLKGAAMVLQDGNACEKLERIRRRCEYIELSSSAFFNDMFLEQMSF